MLHSDQLRTVFEQWKVEASKASPEFQKFMRKQFSTWATVEDFLTLLPSRHTELGGSGFRFCYLWSGAWMLELLTAIPGNVRFVPIGTLMDGSRVCIDVFSEVACSIGAFSFEMKKR